jgi:hypothetical protein
MLYSEHSEQGVEESIWGVTGYWRKILNEELHDV